RLVNVDLTGVIPDDGQPVTDHDGQPVTLPDGRHGGADSAVYAKNAFWPGFPQLITYFNI
ncbi:hypothetical protein A2U01_0114476, partial [Trifolium medium]|nr:hypothetical protein [Trifolium medium]